MADNTLSPDAAEQGPPADGPIITPELRRAVVAAAHAEADLRAAAERVAELRTSADLDDMADPHTYAPDTRYAAAHDEQRTASAVRSPLPVEPTPFVVGLLPGLAVGAQSADDGVTDAAEHGVSSHAAARPAYAVTLIPVADEVAAIVGLITEYGAARAQRQSMFEAFGDESGAWKKWQAESANLEDRIRRTLADALDTRRHREQCTHLPAGRRLVACAHLRGVFEHCPTCDGQPVAERLPEGVAEIGPGWYVGADRHGHAHNSREEVATCPKCVRQSS